MLSLRHFILRCMLLAFGISAYSQICIAQPERYGFPERLDSLTLLKPVKERKDLSPYDKTEILIVWLVREHHNPSPTRQGLGGPITSGYTEAQIITVLFTQGDTLTIAEIAADRGVEPAIRDAMKIVLGLKGDARQIPDLIRILRYSKEPMRRAKAAEALGLLGATEAIPALQEALNDEFFVEGGDCLSPDTLFYPVRGSAIAALNVLSIPDRIDSAIARRQAFALSLQETGQTLINLSSYFRSRGWNVTWDNTNKKADVENRQSNTHVIVGEGYVSINGNAVSLINPPVLMNGRMLIPRSIGVKIAYTASPLAQIARMPEQQDTRS